MQLKGEALKGHLDLILLAALEDGPAYGYSLVARLDQLTGGRLSLSDGTIYPALHRLERAGLLQSKHAVAHGRRRRIYSLTERGEAEFERLRGEWEAFESGVQSLLRRTASTKAAG
jgi:PadR family transcriptional regulator PadR